MPIKLLKTRFVNSLNYALLDVVYYSSILFPTQDGNIPLQRACQYGHLEVVQYLVERGSDVCSLDRVCFIVY